MCGITGFVSTADAGVPDAYAQITRMMAVQAHRGPDDEGCVALENADGGFSLALDSVRPNARGYLGFNRLSIRDVSERGHQPMIGRNGRVALVFNGEIYNTDELKASYLPGVTFASTGDTEVILRLYERYGFDRTIVLLNGMFAIAILDCDERRLYLARDRVGIKPLYVYAGDGLVAFASELKALATTGLMEPTLNRVAFFEIMMMSFCYGKTLINGIEEVTPGTIRAFSLDDGRCEVRRFWSPLDAIAARESLAYDDVVAELPQVLRRCVRRQMVTDVPLGCQLSGGVDSSLVTYEMMRNRAEGDERIKSIGIGIIGSEPALSEERWMREAQRVCGVDLLLEPVSDQQASDDWRRVIWHMDTIPAMSSEGGVLALARRAKQQVTVLLSGEGADELFIGYDRVARNIALLERAGGQTGQDPAAVAAELNVRLFAGNAQDATLSLRDTQLLFNGDGVSRERVERLCPDYREVEAEVLANRRRVIAELSDAGISLWDMMRAYELTVRLPALLVRQDKMTMAASVENRVPFLDNEMIDFALRIPPEILVRRHTDGTLQGKYPLKELAASVFGASFAFRPKIGFSMPIARYVRSIVASPDFAVVQERLARNGAVNRGGLDEFMGEMAGLTTFDDDAILLWRLFSLEMAGELFAGPRSAWT